MVFHLRFCLAIQSSPCLFLFISVYTRSSRSAPNKKGYTKNEPDLIGNRKNTTIRKTLIYDIFNLLDDFVYVSGLATEIFLRLCNHNNNGLVPSEWFFFFKKTKTAEKHTHTHKRKLVSIEIKIHWKVHIVFAGSQDIHIYLKYHKQNKSNAARVRKFETIFFCLYREKNCDRNVKTIKDSIEV